MRHYIPSCSAILPRALIVFLMISLNSAVFAQAPADYYDRSPDVVRRLHTVELHHLDKGINKLESGDLNGLRDLEFILRYFPNHPRVLALYAEYSIKLGRPEDARRSLDRAIKYFPNTVSSYHIYGTFLYKTGNINGAIKQYEKALQLEPNSPQTHYNLGLSYVSNKQYDLANVHAQKAYAGGFRLPGLRKVLMRVGAWRPLSAPNTDGSD